MISPPCTDVLIGPVFTDAACAANPAIFPSAVQWNRKFLDGMRAAGRDTVAVAAEPNRYFPKGRLFINQPENADPRYPHIYIPTLGLPFLRKPYFELMYRLYIRRYLQNGGGGVDHVYTYNPWSIGTSVAQWLQRTQGAKWISLILDYDDPNGDWTRFQKDNAGADGLVFLSHWGYENYPGPIPKFAYTGGFQSWKGADAVADKTEGPRTLLYSGKIEGYGGARLLAEIASGLDPQKYQLRITGKASDPAQIEALRKCPSVEYLGFLSEEALDKEFRQADVLLNVRPVGIQDNRMIFPSKLLRYLEYGKPIVTSDNAGIPPPMKALMYAVCDDEPQTFIDKIQEVASLPAPDQHSLQGRMKAFVESRRDEHVAAELSAWAGKLA